MGGLHEYWSKDRGAATGAGDEPSRFGGRYRGVAECGGAVGNRSRWAGEEVLLHGPAARGPEGLTGDELALLRLYRQCGVAERAELLREARRRALARDG